MFCKTIDHSKSVLETFYKRETQTAANVNKPALIFHTYKMQCNDDGCFCFYLPSGFSAYLS